MSRDDATVSRVTPTAAKYILRSHHPSRFSTSFTFVPNISDTLDEDTRCFGLDLWSFVIHGSWCFLFTLFSLHLNCRHETPKEYTKQSIGKLALWEASDRISSESERSLQCHHKTVSQAI